MIWGYPHFKKPPYIPSGKRTVCYWKWTIEIVDVAIKKLFVFIVMLVYQRVMGKFFQMSWYHFFLDIILELDELGAGCSHIYIIYISTYIYILYLLILRYIKHIFLKWYLKISQRLWVFFFVSEVSEDPWSRGSRETADVTRPTVRMALPRATSAVATLKGFLSLLSTKKTRWT